MTRLDLDPRYEEVLGIEAITVITRLLQVTALVKIQRVSATPVHVNDNR